jgi:hypothetical protein
MSSSHQIRLPDRELQMPRIPDLNRRLEEHIIRALNKIKKPSTTEEITDLLNRDLGPGDRPFQAREVGDWLRNSGNLVLNLHWLASRPRR